MRRKLLTFLQQTKARAAGCRRLGPFQAACWPLLLAIGIAAPGHGGEAGPSRRERPNVLIVLLDDVGFGQLRPFGGPYRVPNIERLAAGGLRYTNFHTTALCSPTRAALLTGRNHHTVNMATITETASSQPGYTGLIPRDAATLASMLQAHGYRTYALGKWHLTPAPHAGAQGPFDHWPTRMGFDHWYGFQGADTDQWAPGLWQDTTPVEPPARANYHLTTDLADHALSFIEEQAQAEEPFFLYFATGAGHAPHHAPKAWIERNRGRFDEGWDRMRARTFAQQQAMGIVPRTTSLPARHPSIPAWDDLSADEKKVYARMQEVHAAFIEHTDAEIGRVLDALQASGKMDNTIVVFTSDNGTSGEGGPIGSVNEFRVVNDPEAFPEVLARLEDLGGPTTYNHYPAGWAQAGNTPFRYWKQMAHGGGVHDPMILSWPQRIKEPGGLRPQFAHVVDVVPTLLEALGLQEPTELAGIKQRPIEGQSFLATLTQRAAPSLKKVQYFEMMGNRGIWADGWKAVTYHGRLPWLQGALSLQGFSEDRWELYDVEQDISESHDLSLLLPRKLAALKGLFDEEAKKHQVYPLDDSGLGERVMALNFLHSSTRRHVYTKPQVRIPEALQPVIALRNYSIEIEADLPPHGAEGVLLAVGGRFGGYSFYIKEGHLHYAYNFVGKETTRLSSPTPLPAGPVNIGFEFVRQPKPGNDTRGLARLMINGNMVAERVIERTQPSLFGFVDTMDIGSDTITPVDAAAYATPFPFTGNLRGVTYDVQLPAST